MKCIKMKKLVCIDVYFSHIVFEKQLKYFNIYSLENNN